MSGGNSWLTRQRKSELVELAQAVGLKDTDGLRKSDLESALDEHLSEHATRYQSDSRFQDYFKSRARAGGSPVKKELIPAGDLKVPRRRATKPVDEITAADDDEEEEETTSPTAVAHAASTALARTPGRALSLASRLPLPASPADVAQAVDRGTVAVRERVASLYQQSGVTEATQTTREWLSTVQAVVSAVALFELYHLRKLVLPDRYAFTIPAFPLLRTETKAVQLPDMFKLVTAEFWAPSLTWALTAVVLPALFGYFFNFSAAAHHGQQARKGAAAGTRGVTARSAAEPVYAVDPLTFSIVKAIVTYVVYAQGVTFGGLLNSKVVENVDEALYSGWQGVVVGSAVSALAAVYDAVLRK